MECKNTHPGKLVETDSGRTVETVQIVSRQFRTKFAYAVWDSATEELLGIFVNEGAAERFAKTEL